MPHEIPKYADSAPSINENCLGQGVNNGLNIIFPPPQGGGGKDTELIEGFSMGITDLSDIDTDRFLIDYAPYEAVDVTLTIVAKESAVVKANPVLSGTIIDAVECDWSYNAPRDGDITIQSIVNTGAGADPTLLFSDRDYDYSGLTMIVDGTVTINGQDAHSNDSDVSSILFGNYIAIGVNDPSLLFVLPANIQAVFDSLVTKTVLRSQAGVQFNAFGTATEYMVIAHPESWGESLFTKGSFTGGYLRIYYVNRAAVDMFVTSIEGGDIVKDISIDNGKNGFTENYFFYMSEYPARTADKPTIISKA